MDEFQPEDELKPDASDRPAARSRKSSPGPKLPVSRQHIMVAVGILVLLMLILGIGSALKSPSGSAPSSTANSSAGNSKDIDLSGSAGMSGQPASANSQAPASSTPETTVAQGNAANPTNAASGHDISMPAISSTPSQGNPAAPTADQQRVTVSGDMGSALNNTQIPDAGDAPQTSLPTAPATLDRTGKLKLSTTSSAGTASPAASTPTAAHRAPQSSVSHSNERKAVAAERERERETRRIAEQRRTEEQRRIAQQRKANQQKVAEHRASESSKSVSQTAKPVKREAAASSVTRTEKPAAQTSSQLPRGEYTLQLSGATRQDALNNWARQQKLSNYHVYQTERNGKPWFVLVSGSYATSAEAKRAISALPEAVRAQSPWVKPLSQVKKEAAK